MCFLHIRNLAAFARRGFGFGVRNIDTASCKDFLGSYVSETNRNESIWDLYEHRYVLESVNIRIAGFFAVTAEHVIWVKQASTTDYRDLHEASRANISSKKGTGDYRIPSCYSDTTHSLYVVNDTSVITRYMVVDSKGIRLDSDQWFSGLDE